MNVKYPNWWTGFDPFHHKTQSDIDWSILHEVDLYREGEDSDIKTKAQLKEAKVYAARTTNRPN